MTSGLNEQAQRLVIYIGESDRWRGKPLYAAILETLKKEGLAGATVLRGVAGFGAHSRIHTASIVRLSEDLPLVIHVIDAPEKIARAVERVAPMVREGLITLEDVRVLRYTHRYLNPLPADRLVKEVMTRQVVTLAPEDTVAHAWQKMLDTLIKAMPVVTSEGQVVGMLTDEDLLERAGINQRLAVAGRLDESLLKAELEALQRSPLRVADVMSQPPILAQAEEPLGVAAARMASSGMKRLPVVDDRGRLVGVLSRVDILRLVAQREARVVTPPAGAVRTVGQVMVASIPVVRRDDPLPVIVDTLLESGLHRLIVLDDQGKAIGLISDSDVVARVQPSQQAGVLAALRRAGRVPESQVTAEQLMSPGVLTARADTPLTEAVQQMVSLQRKWLVVVDEHDRPLGLVDRHRAFRALTLG